MVDKEGVQGETVGVENRGGNVLGPVEERHRHQVPAETKVLTVRSGHHTTDREHESQGVGNEDDLNYLDVDDQNHDEVGD